MKKIAKYLIWVLALAFVLYKGYDVAQYYYYASFDGNDEIIILDFEGDENYDCNDILNLPQLVGKPLFVTVNHRGDWPEFRASLSSMASLYNRYHEQLTFVYTSNLIESSEDRYEMNESIKKYDLKGYHIKLPLGYDDCFSKTRRTDSATITMYAKYMLVSADRQFMNQRAIPPRHIEKLGEKIDSLLNN